MTTASTPTSPASSTTGTVYQCPDCGEQTLQRRCEDCNLFTRRLGAGGHCPHCDEVVLLADLDLPPARSTTGSYTDNLTSSAPVANVAAARELAGWCWSLATLDPTSEQAPAARVGRR
jgi:predicted RNA-binding Zn-ribbon protein involved in translation (DUF1610 family)